MSAEDACANAERLLNEAEMTDDLVARGTLIDMANAWLDLAAIRIEAAST